MTTGGVIVDETPLPSDDQAIAIAPGADGSMWISKVAISGGPHPPT